MSYIKVGMKLDNNMSGDTYIFKTVLDYGYEDVTNLGSWFGFVDCYNMDYLLVRDYAKQYVDAVGFSGLTHPEKVLAAQHFLVGKADRDTVYTDSEQEDSWVKFVTESQKVRGDRWFKAKCYVSFRLSVIDSTDLAESTLSLNEKYIKYNIKYKSIDGIDGLFDWLEGLSSFSGGTGFQGKSYYTTTLRDGIINKLNGL